MERQFLWNFIIVVIASMLYTYYYFNRWRHVFYLYIKFCAFLNFSFSSDLRDLF